MRAEALLAKAVRAAGSVPRLTSFVVFVLAGLLCGPAAGDYMGCFTDSSTRALASSQGTGFGISSCNDRCRSLGFVYSGSQWYDQCFCGNTLGYEQVPNYE